MAEFDERQDGANSKLSQKELSQLARDFDVVWLGERAIPSGGVEIMHRLAGIAPEEAAQIFQDQLGVTDAIQLDERLGALGIACGVLSKNKGIPSGVIGGWRADIPILLISNDIPKGFDRPKEIAREIGLMAYGEEDKKSAEEFAELMRAIFVEISVESSASSTPRRSLRQLASAAFRR